MDIVPTLLPWTVRPRLGVAPVPVKATVCGLSAALSVMVSEPESEPVAVGEKTTLMKQN